MHYQFDEIPIFSYNTGTYTEEIFTDYFEVIINSPKSDMKEIFSTSGIMAPNEIEIARHLEEQ